MWVRARVGVKVLLAAARLRGYVRGGALSFVGFVAFVLEMFVVVGVGVGVVVVVVVFVVVVAVAAAAVAVVVVVVVVVVVFCC